MATKQVTGLGKLGLRVAATTADRARNGRAMQGVIARCEDVVPPGTTSITLEEAQYYAGRQIQFEITLVRERDNAHVAGLLGTHEQRRERDAATAEVYGTLLLARRAYEATHGEGTGIQLLGLDTTVPDDPLRLYQAADRTRVWLRDPRRPMPEARLPGFTYDAEALAAGLDGPVARLGKALAVLPEEEKHSVDTLVSKLTEMRRLDQLIGQVARMLEALYDVAGMEGESDRIRQSSHRSTESETEESASEESETEESETEKSETA